MSLFARKNLRIKEYRLVKRIASGATGVIWRAEPRDKGSVRAVKILHKRLKDDAREAGFLRNEYRVVHGFDHPGLLDYYECGDLHGVPYILMEFFPSRSLADYQEEAKRPALRPALRRVMIATAEALAHAHERNVVHRDVKPGNILVDKQAKVKVVDFAIAIFANRLIDSAKFFSRLLGKTSRTTAGTPNYMAPEQIRGEHVTQAADIYSLGATLYDLLAGRPPFPGDTPEETMTRALGETPPPPSQFDRSITADAEKLLQAMMAKDPAHRPPDMTVVAHRLGKIKLFRDHPPASAAD